MYGYAYLYIYISLISHVDASGQYMDSQYDSLWESPSAMLCLLMGLAQSCISLLKVITWPVLWDLIVMGLDLPTSFGVRTICPGGLHVRTNSLLRLASVAHSFPAAEGSVKKSQCDMFLLLSLAQRQSAPSCVGSRRCASCADLSRPGKGSSTLRLFSLRIPL